MAPPATATDDRCPDHPAVRARARCATCDRLLCNECYRFRLDERPACARCAYESATRARRRVSFASAFLCVTWGGAVWATRRFELWDEHAVLLVLFGAVALVVAALIARTAQGERQPALENRDPDEEAAPELDHRGNPFRANARRALLAASPRVSGRATAMILVASLAASATLLPASMKLPRWLEVEAVLAAWWAIVATTLVVLLYRGFRLRDDWVYLSPWNRPNLPSNAAPATSAKPAARSRWYDGCSPLDGCSGLDGEGFLGALVIGLAVLVGLGVSWVFVELVMPVAFLLMYALFMRAIGRVANDRHGCEGRALAAMGWGALWATLYVCPIALLTWALHASVAAH